MSKLIKKYGWLLLAFVIYVVLNYNPQLLFETSYRHWGWNLSALTTVFILIIFHLRDPLTWKQKLGIDFKLVDWIGFLLLTSSLLLISYFLVGYLSEVNGYAFRPMLIHYKTYCPADFPFLPILGDYIYYIPQTLNEEIFIGAILLLGLERNFKNLNKNVLAIGVALVFSLMHQGMYKWSPVQPGILLSAYTILTLFFVGVLRNVLILKTRKIAYAWAIHLSFNMIFFSGFCINNQTNTFASEPERFNIVLGNWPIALVMGVLAFLSIVWLNKDRVKNMNAATND